MVAGHLSENLSIGPPFTAADMNVKCLVVIKGDSRGASKINLRYIITT